MNRKYYKFYLHYQKRLVISNDIYHIHVNQTIFSRISSLRDRRTDNWTVRWIKFINNLQICWKVSNEKLKILVNYYIFMFFNLIQIAFKQFVKSHYCNKVIHFEKQSPDKFCIWTTIQLFFLNFCHDNL